MKILYLRTSSFQCDPHVGSLEQLAESQPDKYKLVIQNYFVDKVDQQITEWAAHYKPDVIVWIGVAAGPHKPAAATFWLLRMSKIKTIMLCPEASHPDWDALIQEFYEKESFDLIVNLDGNRSWNHHGKGHTTLAIYDQRPYNRPQIKWRERPIDVGFCGGIGFAGTMRQRLIDHLKNNKTHTFKFEEFPFVDKCNTYQQYADFLMSCKMIVNPAGSSGERSLHVKGRVIEAALARCLLLEQKDSPTSQWFPIDSFVQFSDPEQCERLIQSILSANIGTYRVSRFHEHALHKYSPQVLWTEIFAKIGHNLDGG